jgi:hypothetical protein
MVRHLVAAFDLPATEDVPTPTSGMDYFVEQVDTFTCLDLADPDLFHRQLGSGIVSFHDRPWFPPWKDPPATVYWVANEPHYQCVIFTDYAATKHTVSLLHVGMDILWTQAPPSLPLVTQAF